MNKTNMGDMRMRRLHLLHWRIQDEAQGLIRLARSFLKLSYRFFPLADL